MRFSLFNLFIFVLIVIFSFKINAESSILGNRKVKTLSDKKLLQIEKIVQRAFKQDKDAKYNDIKSSILGEVENIFPINEKNKLLNVDFNKIEDEAKKEAKEKYPLTEKQLEEKYMAEANEKFTPAKLHTEVEATYKIGRDKIVKVSGVYRGLNRYHNGLLIGNNVVPVYDLIPEDKARFIEYFRTLRKKTYTIDKTDEYLDSKENYRLKLINKKITAINKENEKNGYIFAWRKWRTPADTANMIYKYQLVQVLKDKNDLSKSSSTAAKTNQPNNKNTNTKKQVGLKTLINKRDNQVKSLN